MFSSLALISLELVESLRQALTVLYQSAVRSLWPLLGVVDGTPEEDADRPTNPPSAVSGRSSIQQPSENC